MACPLITDLAEKAPAITSHIHLFEPFWVKGHLGQRSRGSRSVLGSLYWQVGSLQRQVAFFHNYTALLHATRPRFNQVVDSLNLV